MPIIQTKELNGLFVNGNWQIYVYEIILSLDISFPNEYLDCSEYLDCEAPIAEYINRKDNFFLFIIRNYHWFHACVNKDLKAIAAFTHSGLCPSRQDIKLDSHSIKNYTSCVNA